MTGDRRPAKQEQRGGESSSEKGEVQRPALKDEQPPAHIELYGRRQVQPKQTVAGQNTVQGQSASPCLLHAKSCLLPWDLPVTSACFLHTSIPPLLPAARRPIYSLIATPSVASVCTLVLPSLRQCVLKLPLHKRQPRRITMCKGKNLELFVCYTHLTNAQLVGGERR